MRGSRNDKCPSPTLVWTSNSVCDVLPCKCSAKRVLHSLDTGLSCAQVQGGGLRDSFLVDGVAFKKTFSYAGFEMQPRSFSDPPILLLNIELELKAEKENAEVRLRLCHG